MDIVKDVRAEEVDGLLEPGRNCWRIARADRAALVVDAADYFRHARHAMMKARSQILMIGWDFDTRILLDHDCEDDGAPARLGPFLSWLAKNRPGLSIHILKWDLGALKLLGRGTTILRLARWAWSKQIFFKLDGAHPFGASHHHKILVVDDSLAFCGGIDMTASRWDTRGHVDKDKRRKRPTTGRLYGPWHDATMAVGGPAAAALGELARDRWCAAGGARFDPPEAKGDVWPEELEPMFRDVDVAVARTRGAYKETPAAREIEALFLDMIAGARRFVYAENQFFASRAIGQAIATRLAEPDGPEFVIVNPRTVEGWVEEKVMGPARARLMRVLAKADRHGRFRIYTPVTQGGEDIYVHSKIVVADDEVLRVGSANMNNRSMGLDSECDLLIDGRLECNAGAKERIAAIRADLLAEHLGVASGAVEAKLAATGSLIAAIEALRGAGRTLVPFVPDEPGAIEAAIADSEALDPEGAGDDFEPLARPGLFAGLRAAIGRRRERRRAAKA
ncbi:MAG TPA: phospholipase D-like domain-containing protein [Allosphingosinicella sp.]|nr:phospholipase D-like domain-containing protein [Allosphingosinicella sp.]